MQTTQFSVGVNYWPRRSAHALWERFDPAEVRDDFAHIASLGLDTVRFFVRWDLFAPRIDELDPVLLDRLATIVSLAGEAGLRAFPALFCGNMGGINWLPEWALDRAAPRGARRTFTGNRESPLGCGNLYAGPLLDAQIRLARAVAERVGAHPALGGWDIGHAFSNVRRPSSAKVHSGEHSQAPADERVVAVWARRLTETLSASAPVAVTAGTHADDLLEDRDIRLGSLCAPFAFASMQGSNLALPFARSRLDPEALPFLAMLAAGFSYKPVLVSGFGYPTCPPGKFSAFERFAANGEPPLATIDPDDSVFATYPCLTDDEVAFVANATLDRLHADGRLGAYWWCWADVPDAFAARPPFDLAPHERWYGIVRPDGSEKPLALALRAFTAQRRSVCKATDMPAIAGAYYYRTLPTSTGTLYDAFLRFIEERRTSPRP